MTAAPVPPDDISRVGRPGVTASWGRLISALLGRIVIVTVRGISMEPTFCDGDRILVHRGRKLAVGTVVVVECPKRRSGSSGLWKYIPSGATTLRGREWMIKRVVATPGDPVPHEQVPALAEVADRCVPPGKLVLLGDNRKASFDSRQLGYIPIERVLGVVLSADAGPPQVTTSASQRRDARRARRNRGCARPLRGRPRRQGAGLREVL